ncbi:MAG: hypothetical protein JZU50_14720 [Desulfobulbaceae bacterium]|jgi:hypothetical protein|nr:hypothetical protein [Desulfobulbaceae bacterium]
MEMFNFSSGETARFNRALTFVHRQELDIELSGANTLIVKTENFEDECEQLAPYFSGLGLENANARLVFNPAKGGSHKILVNKAAISKLSYIHTMVTELVHLGHLLSYNAECGNIYRFTQDQAIAEHYYEFLLWTKFQAMKVATRAHALVSWHEVNGEAAPVGGCYQFAEVNFYSERVAAALGALQGAGSIAVWREGLWDLLEELAFYLGRLAFYQQTARPWELDEGFPAAAIEAMVGQDNCLALCAALQQAKEYSLWQEQKRNIRKAILAMQEHGKGLFAPRA